MNVADIAQAQKDDVTGTYNVMDYGASGAAVLTTFAAGQVFLLPFTISITPATPKILPEYLDNINAVTKDQSMYQDWPFSTAVIDGEFWVMQKCGYSETVVRYKGTNIEDAVKQPDGRLNLTHPAWGTVVAPYILGGMWYDSKEKKLYAPLHCEYPSIYGPGDIYGSKLNRQIHLATSADKGLTWNYEGPIITRDDPKTPHQEPEYSGSLWDGGEGDFYLYADESHGYIYVYTSHNLWPKPGNSGPRFWAHHVARCAISDKMAPGKWRKFYNGGWSEPALGGKASYVEACNVIYCSHIGKYLSFNLGGGLAACSDLSKQDWTPSFCIPGGLWGYNDVWAWALTDAGKTHVSRFDKTLYVYTYWHLKPGSAFRIDIGKGETPATDGYTGAGVAAPMFARTMNPIRPYGEPLYDNADPIESRRVRKVGCENTEMSYSDGWDSQDSPVKARVSGTSKSSVTFVFKGAGIFWRAATGQDCGKADVYLDDVFQKTVDLYGDFTPYQFGFMKTGLDASKAHTIRIVVKGEKNSKSSGAVVKHLSFEYFAESYQASDGFSSIMGKNQWHYQAWDGAGYANLEFNIPGNVWTICNRAVAVGPNYQTADDANDAVRKWVSPHGGTVRIEGIAALSAGGGDGIKVKILRNTTEVWGPQLVTFGNPLSHDFSLDVAGGDSLCFCISRNNTGAPDNVAWDPVVTFTGK